MYQRMTYKMKSALELKVPESRPRLPEAQPRISTPHVSFTAFICHPEPVEEPALSLSKGSRSLAQTEILRQAQDDKRGS